MDATPSDSESTADSRVAAKRAAVAERAAPDIDETSKMSGSEFSVHSEKNSEAECFTKTQKLTFFKEGGKRGKRGEKGEKGEK